MGRLNNPDRQLTASQLEVLEAVRQGKRVIVKACAGSGKTTTLVRSYTDKLKEITSFLNADDPFNHLLAITFTNEAAVKLKRDVFRETGGNIRALTNRTISTIHSFCNNILRENIVESGLSPDYRIAEEYDVAQTGESVLERIVSENILKDAELRTFITEHGWGARGKLSNSGFCGMVMAAYRWIRAEGFDLGEGLETLRRRKVAYKDWLTKRGHGDVETATYIDRVDRYTALIEKYLAAYWKRMETEKREKGILSYDDIIYYAYRLLREYAHIRERYRRQFLYVFVDEFQDTDALQLEVVDMISERGKQFFVGDPQQLIYEWRNANPELFARAEQDALGDNDGSSVIYLRENFRSSEGIISFVNHLFSGLMKEGKTAYVEMEAARKDLKECDDEPSVSILVPKGETQNELHVSEAAMIASEISRIVEEGATVVDMHDRKRRKAKYSDIAVLFRSRSAVKLYEEKLEEEGIPFIGLQVSTFFERPEIIALRDCVMHLARPSDAFYTASVMRSPIFDVEDDFIAASAACKFDMDKMRTLAGESDHTSLARFIWLDAWCRSAAGVRVSSLMMELIRKSGFDMLCLAGNRGIEAYANIVSFIELLRRFESEGLTGPQDIADELEEMMERGAEPGSPLYDESSNAVRLMTVHEAKGLEFPIVFVAGSFSRPRHDNYDMFIHRDFGTIIREIDTGSNPLRSFYEGVEEDLDRLKIGGNEEEKRIFYVAATRAQQKLYISACSRNANSWSNEVWKMLSAAGIDAATASQGVLSFGKGKVLLLQSPRYVRKAGHAIQRDVRIDRKVLGLDLSHARKTERFAMTPTSLAGYMVCHHKSLLSAAGNTEVTGSGSVSGLERGSMIHAFLEHYDYVRSKEPAFLKDTFGEKYGDIASSSLRFIQSDIGQEAGRAATEGRLFRELPFSALHRRGILNGKVDMIITGTDTDTCTVVDYKSGRADSHPEEYRNQLLTYASAVLKITGCNSIRLVNFFVDEKEPIRSFTVSRSEVEAFDSQLEASMEAYDGGDRTASPGKIKCDLCAFRNTCEFRFVDAVDKA